jgi:sugar phosphate permease
MAAMRCRPSAIRCAVASRAAATLSIPDVVERTVGDMLAEQDHGHVSGGLAALVMTGTLYGTSHFHWLAGFIFGASLGLLATVTVVFLVRRPTEQQMQAAVRAAPDEVPATKPAIV